MEEQIAQCVRRSQSMEIYEHNKVWNICTKREGNKAVIKAHYASMIDLWNII